MNFYTVAAKMDREAVKYALENTEFHGSFKEAYSYKLDTLMGIHERVMDIGSQLLESYGTRMKGGRHYMITIRPADGSITFEKFKSDVMKFVQPLLNYELAFEQKGECTEDLGKGFHVHIIMKGTTEQHYPSKLLRNAQKEFKYVAAHCIQVDTLRNLDKAREYIRGKKNDEKKMRAVEFDKQWRSTCVSLGAHIYASGQVHPLAVVNNVTVSDTAASGPSAAGPQIVEE